MNYERIYAEFIADRRVKEPEKPQYFERHHILPRCLGGGDEPDNLIRLTPEDHFFAHLLLAKIHGGELWAPVAFMVGGSRKDYKPTHSRKKYGWVCRALSRAKSGEGAYQYDYTIHHIRHRDGREWSGTQYEMSADLGMTRPLANLFIKGKVNLARGWYFPDRHETAPTTEGVRHHMYRNEVHHFVHVDGREFVGTQFEFHITCGVSKPAASKLARRKVKVWNGWHLKGQELPTHGRASRWRKYQLEQSAT